MYLRSRDPVRLALSGNLHHPSPSEAGVHLVKTREWSCDRSDKTSILIRHILRQMSIVGLDRE